MPETVGLLASIAAGVLCTSGVLALAGPKQVLIPLAAAVPRIARGHRARGPSGWLERGHGRLLLEISRAGWQDSPQRLAVLAAIVGVGTGTLALGAAAILQPAASIPLAVAGGAAGTGAVVMSLRSAVTSRRRKLTRELAPLLELFVLELSGGGSPLSALGSVTMQIDGELAAELRRLLIASQVAGLASFEARLRAYADHLQLPALGTLATTLTASREYGTPVTQGVRALAADLRRTQRRELIAHSRRALNHVLFPAAAGVLLPFLAILLFPAVSALQRNLR